MKIIITDAHSRKAFDIINILKNVHNYDLLLFATKGYRFPLPLIYKQKVHRLRDDEFEDFKEDLLEILHRNPAEEYIYLPVSEVPTLHFYQLMKNNSDLNIKYLLPGKEIFELVRDKKRFQVFCEERGLPVPSSYNMDKLPLLKKDFHPVIAKRKISAGSVGMKYIDQPEQLDILEGIDSDEYLIQQKVKSCKKIHGGFYLCKKGEVKIYHGHVRIRTFPEKGGVTVFSKADYSEELKKIGEKLLKKLNWSGLAMIEFLYDDYSESWKIIELNPRLWGSIMLSEFCQSRLLSNYVNLSQNNEVESGIIETERYIRWLFPFEVISLLKGKIGLREFLNLSHKKTCYINFTYSTFSSAWLFQLYFTFNGRSIKRFFNKIFS